MDILQKIHTINILSPKLEKEKALFLKRLGGLLEEGYSIQHSLQFIKKFEVKQIKEWIVSLQDGLVKGNAFHEELEKIGYSSKVCSQIYLASQYGDYGKTISRCADDLLKEQQFKKKLIGLLSYPLLLLGFLLSMLMLMRFLILPNMENLFSNNLSATNIYADLLVSFIYYSPQIIVINLFLSLIGYIILGKYLGELSAIEQIHFFIKWPVLNKYLRSYWTSFLFLEWGQLLKRGVSFHELVSIMSKEDSSPVLKETASILSEEMTQGKTVKESLEVLPFFEKETFSVISHGENLGQLGSEMTIYASYCEEELSENLEKMLEKLQPIIFIFIGLMIIAIYASMILPIYTLMEGI